MNEEYEVIHYIDAKGKDTYLEWVESLRDKRGQIAIYRAVARVERGNFGDHHFCRDGVSELVINCGPGYRVYYSIVGRAVVLLLCAGDKRSQSRDIDRAVLYLKKYKEE